MLLPLTNPYHFLALFVNDAFYESFLLKVVDTGHQFCVSIFCAHSKILRHARRDELHRIGLVVGSGGEDQSLATQVFVSAGGDVVLDGLATGGFVDAKGGVGLFKWLNMG